MNLSVVLLILGILFWSGNYVLGKAVVATFPPLTLAYLRWLLALLFFLPFSWQELRTNYQMVKENRNTFILLGMTGVLGFNYFQYLAVQYTTAINANIINAASPMVTAAFAALLLKERLYYRQTIGLFLSLLGVLFIITRGSWQVLLNFALNKGDLLMLLAVLTNTSYFLLLRLRGTGVPPKTLLAASMMGGLAATWFVPVWENCVLGLGWIESLNISHLVSLFYFAIFPSILSIMFINRAVLELGPVKTSVFQNLGIVFTSIMGIVFLEEKLYPPHFLGTGLIFMGIYLNTKTNSDVEDKSA